MDPKLVLDQGRDDYLINLAILKCALKERNQEEVDKIELLSKMIAVEFAQAMGNIF
jgi:hypothetical protein